MNKQYIKLIFVSVLCVLLVQSGISIVQAQGTNVSNITFTQLGRTEIDLIGPFDSYSFSFAIPADWKIVNGAKLNLSLGASFNAEAIDAIYEVGSVSGTLTVSLNSYILDAIPIGEVGEIERVIEIPVEVFESIEPNGRMTIRFTLDNRIACYFYDSNQHMQLYVHERSYFSLPYQSVQPDTSLSNFPWPIYQNSFDEDTALLVIPDQPSTAELQAAMTVASGLSNLTSGGLILDLTSLSQLNPEQANSTHLIYIGNAASLPILETLEFPLPTSGGEFVYDESDPEDGIIQMINSPTSLAHILLVVSGNTDTGTVKAAQALGTGMFLTPQFPNLSVIEEVQLSPMVTQTQLEGTSLADLGYSGRVFESRGVDVEPYSFYIPPGKTVSFDANFEMVFGHSALIDYERSGLSIYLNNSPIGSVRLDDTTAQNAPNRVKIPIPSSLILPGINILEVMASLIPSDYCTPPELEGMWVNLWADSTFNMPLVDSTPDLFTKLDLASYPTPLITEPMLSNLAFVLPHDDLETWQSAAQMASFLGERARGTLTALKVFYGDEVPEAEREKYNFIVIGTANQLPIISEINRYLPVPFEEESDSVPMEDNFQVTFRIPTTSPMGYVELLSSPWNQNNVMLAILGNQPQGLGWAATSLIDAALRAQLSGNFAVVNDQQILTTDTRLAPSVTTEYTEDSGVVVLPPDEGTSPPSLTEPPRWILPVLITLVALIVIIIVAAIIRKWVTRAR
ncbi:MAG: cellulose biosynthesis cyclic di-GMP-binding regulatory protein BcsB [Anaerolineales bacterium]|jgi:hypothetical protein